MTDSSAQWIGLAALTVVGALLIWGVLRFAWRACRGLVTWLGEHQSLFGATPQRRLISLGVAVLLFPTAISQAIDAALRFVWGLVYVLLETFAESLPHLERPFRGTDRSADDAFEALQRFISDFTREIGSLVDALLARLLLDDLILATAVWAIVAAALGRHDGEAEKPGDIKLFESWRRLPDGFRANAPLTALLLVGVYLSIAAIVAIPWMQEDRSPAQLAESQLEQRLQSSSLSSAKLEEQYPMRYGADGDPLTALEENLSAVTLPDDAAKKRIAAGWVRQVRRQLSRFRDREKRLLNDWQSFRQEVVLELEAMQRRALDQFSLSHIGTSASQDKADHFLRITEWYRANVRNSERQLAAFLDFVDGHYEAWSSWGTRTLDSLRWTTGQLESATEPDRVEFELTRFDARMNGRRLQRELFQRSASVIPNPPSPGSALGPFGFVARWLLETRSFPLALITGMLGFGLLGAAVTSFVREQPDRKRGEPLVKDLGGVMVRGLSAAIILFLAVEGGLAVFNVGTSQPNPYVLFFSCLVGAAVSETVWEWARKRFLAGLGRRPPVRDEPGDETEDAPPAG